MRTLTSCLKGSPRRGSRRTAHRLFGGISSASIAGWFKRNRARSDTSKFVCDRRAKHRFAPCRQHLEEGPQRLQADRKEPGHHTNSQLQATSLQLRS
jgi:hypothetical protein